MMKKPFSKKLLILDYLIAGLLITGYFVCVALNGIYVKEYLDSMIISGMDISMVSVPLLFNLDGFTVLLGSWIIQLGVSSGAYYYVIRKEHSYEIPINWIESLPKETRDTVDMTQVITSVISYSGN